MGWFESWYAWRQVRGRLYKDKEFGWMSKILNGVLWNWYWVIVGGAIMVTYTVYTHLPPGLISGILSFIESKIGMLNRVAANCTPLILDMPNFYQCLVVTN